MRARILIADDNERMRRQIVSLLQSANGWEICGAARDGKEAVEMAHDLRPDLIVMDLQMPVMNGFSSASKILDEQPQTPIVLYALDTSPRICAAAAELGIRRVVAKGSDELIPAIKSLLDHTDEPNSR